MRDELSDRGEWFERDSAGTTPQRRRPYRSRPVAPAGSHRRPDPRDFALRDDGPEPDLIVGFEKADQSTCVQLAEAGVPCSAVLDTLDLWNDPHLRTRGLIETVEHPVYETVELMRSPIRISGNEVPLRAAPLLGAHTDEVLRGDLGLHEATIEGLREAGEIA